MARPPELYVLSTYPPRLCGLATFAFDLASAVALGRGEELGERGSVRVIAMSEQTKPRRYAPEVRRIIRASYKEDYVAAADFVNGSSAEVVSLQHEYGIFGGRTGRNVSTFLERLAKPVVATLHTVLAEPRPREYEILREVCTASSAVAVQTGKAAEFLTEIYDVPEAKVRVIAHGTPDVPFADPAPFKKEIEAEGRKVLLTFGLLSPRKGIQVAIRALAAVAPSHPSSLYIILGKTHPNIVKRYGESYRESLQKLVDRLGLHDNVRFVNRFVNLPELLTYLRAADIYVSPYLNADQISSGTLAYAVACGRATISTPYWFAEEVLDDGRGVLVDFRDWRQLAFWLCELMGDDGARAYMAREAYRYGRGTTWAKAAAAYEMLFRNAVRERAIKAAPEARPVAAAGAGTD
jgi:glycosyltransferase involved in cell wall biosynthesis